MGCKINCNCNESMANTGTTCSPLIKITSSIIMVPFLDSTGAQNSIDASGNLDSAYFSGLINQSDSSKRIFPVPAMKNIVINREDIVTEDFDDSTKGFVRNGIKGYTGVIIPPYASYTLEGKLNSARCNSMGIYIVDVDGNIRGGSVSDDKTKLYPYKIDSQTFSAKFIEPTGKTLPKVEVKFNFDQTTEDSCQGMIEASNISVDARNFKGLLDFSIAVTTPTSTGVILTLTTDYGSILNPIMAKGFVAADFTFSNVTVPGSIGIAGSGGSISEDEGVYTIAYDTADQPASTNVIKVVVNKAGYAITSKNFTTA